ncbi:hypothetical protein ABPG72_002602 [Tetrahymena utriculariae]
MQQIQEEQRVIDLSQQHFVEDCQLSFKLQEIVFCKNTIKLSILTSDSFTQKDALSDDLFQVFIENKQLKKDSILAEVKKEIGELYVSRINTYYHFDNLRVFDNIFFKYSIYSKSIKLIAIKDYHKIGQLKQKFYGKFKFQELSHNILNFICFFLLPHESLNLFLTFKSNSLSRVIKEPIIWKQYANYLELKYKDEEIDRETFFKFYRNRQLGFELKKCKSIYNQNYQCQVKKISFSQTNIKIDFRVQGDQSLGGLQDPMASKLSLNNKYLNLIDDQCIFEEVENSQSKHIYDGFLIYQKPKNMKVIPKMTFNFEFGQDGYSNAQIFQISDENLFRFELFQLFEKTYQNQFKFQLLPQNILIIIFSFLYPHESVNLFLTFKSTNLTKLIQEPTIWQQYFKYLNLQANNQIFSRDSFAQSYINRKISIELNGCKSVYDQNYQCELHKISLSKRHVKIDFTVQGNNSLGSLQNPIFSQLILFGQNQYQELQVTDFYQIKIENQPGKQVCQGILTYEYPTYIKLTNNLSFIFEYGKQGYSQVEILLVTNELIQKHELYHFM